MFRDQQRYSHTVVVVKMLLLRDLLVLLKMISGVSELLLARETIEGRHPIVLRFISFLGWRILP